jgi:hypothetical protein
MRQPVSSITTMAKALLTLMALALLCSGAVAQSYVEVFIKWDNRLSQTRSADKAIREELAKELCKVPVNQVRTLRVLDKSRFGNTESWLVPCTMQGYYACTAANTKQLGEIVANCKNRRLQKEFDDELQDRTTPDQEYESIVCTLR